jgi:hypothetical protein
MDDFILSRGNEPVRAKRNALVYSILRIQIAHQDEDAVERGQATLACFPHRGSGAAFGTLTSKGKAFSAATRVSRTRTASDTDNPMAANVLAA